MRSIANPLLWNLIWKSISINTKVNLIKNERTTRNHIFQLTKILITIHNLKRKIQARTRITGIWNKIFSAIIWKEGTLFYLCLRYSYHTCNSMLLLFFLQFHNAYLILFQNMGNHVKTAFFSEMIEKHPTCECNLYSHAAFIFLAISQCMFTFSEHKKAAYFF